MICPNPNCKSNIPDDSKFCPDCGTPVKNEEELRRKAKEIVTMFPKGYEYFVNIDSLPRFVHNLKIVNCEKIIAKKQEIIKKHNEILQEEKRKQQEQERQRKIEYERHRRIEAERAAEQVRQRQIKILTEQKKKREFVEKELARLHITDQDKIKMFLNNPELIKDQHWINWAKSSQKQTKRENVKTEVVVDNIAGYLIICGIIGFIIWIILAAFVGPAIGVDFG